jgi:transposase
MESTTMGFNFIPYNQGQLYLLPPSIEEWVEEGSLARFVNDLIDYLAEQGKLEGFFAGYRQDGWGHPAFHPQMLVKVVVYAYCIGVTSARKIARTLETDVALRYLSANQQPDFRTISDFRKHHVAELQTLFVEVLRLCQEAGLAKMGRVALDGRKVQGNAALDQNRSKTAIVAEVKRLLAEADRVDTEEDRRLGPNKRGDELPAELRHKADRLRRLSEAQARLDAQEQATRAEQAQKVAQRAEDEAKTGKKKRGRKPKKPEEVSAPETKANVTDPDSRILKTRRSWVQGYNGQAVADCESQVIVAQDVTQEENDVRQLEPMLQRTEEQAGKRPEAMSADAGYWSEANEGAGGEQTELFIATTKDWKQRKALREKGAPRGRIPRDATVRDLMERKLLTKRGRAVYRLRGATIEPVFGQMAMRGLTRFLLRGIEKARGEWALWCATHNMLKLWRAGWSPQWA